MGFLSKVIGILCALYGLYVLSIFTAFILDFKPYLKHSVAIPSINDNCNEEFKFYGLIKMIFWIFIFGIHHSLFARHWMAKHEWSHDLQLHWPR